MVDIIYCDGIASQSFGAGVTKFILGRFEPTAGIESKDAMVAQIVMPTSNFVVSFAFLEHRLQHMIANGDVKPEEVAAARKYWAEKDGK